MCDRRTERQNYDSQERASIGVSHGKNRTEFEKSKPTQPYLTACKSFSFSIFMAALRSGYGHHIFVLWFHLLLLSFSLVFLA